MPKIKTAAAPMIITPPATGMPGTGMPGTAGIIVTHRPGWGQRALGSFLTLTLAGCLLWLAWPSTTVVGGRSAGSSPFTYFLLGLAIFLGVLALGSWVYLVLVALERVRQARIETAERHLFREQAVANVDKARAEADKARAEAEQAYALAAKTRRESEVVSITAKADEQLWISDLNHNAWWRGAHQEARLYANSKDTYTPPTPEEWMAHQLWRAKNGAAPAALPMLPSTSMPDMVDLFELLSGPASLHRLILGVTLDEQGQRRTVTGDLAEMYHIAIGGSSGWGKSGFLRQLVYQVMLAQERPALLLVDLERNALAPFANSPRLLRPLAGTEEAAYNLFSWLLQEMYRRLQLFEKAGVDDWAGYNQIEDTEQLRAIVCVVDEFNDLMEMDAIRPVVQRVARHCRKTGIRLILAAQEWTLKYIDAMTRRQLSTRLQFWATDSAQARTLVGKEGAALLRSGVKGRAAAVVPGQKTILLQSPYLSREVIVQAVPGKRAARPVGIGPVGVESSEGEIEAEIEAVGADAGDEWGNDWNGGDWDQVALPGLEPALGSLPESADAKFKRLVLSGMSRNQAAIEAYNRGYSGNLIALAQRMGLNDLPSSTSPVADFAPSADHSSVAEEAEEGRI